MTDQSSLSGVRKTMPHYDTLHDRTALARMYETRSAAQIARELGCAKSTVLRYLTLHGIERREPSTKAPGQAGAEIRKPARKRWRPSKQSTDGKERIRVSWWRLHILAGRCPLDCPDTDFCTSTPERPDDGRRGCIMFNRLQHWGELRARPWEPPDPFEHYTKRFADVGAEIDDDEEY